MENHLSTFYLWFILGNDVCMLTSEGTQVIPFYPDNTQVSRDTCVHAPGSFCQGQNPPSLFRILGVILSHSTRCQLLVCQMSERSLLAGD